MRGACRLSYKKVIRKEVTDAEYIAIHPFAGNLYAGGGPGGFSRRDAGGSKIDFYKGIELPVIFQKENIAKVRRIARKRATRLPSGHRLIS